MAGEAGIGKTRLVDAFAGRIRDAGGRVLAGGCLPLGTGDLPYGPFVEALRGLIRTTEPGALPAVLGANRGELARLLPEVRPGAGRAEAMAAESSGEPGSGEQPGPSEDRFAQVRLFEVVLGVIERLSRAGPVLLIVEDIQWADPSTLDLLAFLVRNLRDEPVLVLVTVRTDELDPRDPVLTRLADLERMGTVDRVDLVRLTRDDLSRLLHADAGRPVPAVLLDRIWDRTGGNPFYAEQMLAVASESRPHEIGGDDLPPRLRDLLRARVARVSEPGQDVLRVASAAGARIDDALLADVVELSPSDLRDALREVTDRRILEVAGRPGDRYLEFRHALLREVIHDDLLPAERAACHARFAEALERRAAERAAGRATTGPPPVPAELAYHWDAAGDDGKALIATVAAGSAAERAFAWAEANRLYRRALELFDRVGASGTDGIDRPELCARLADTAVLVGDYDNAVRFGRAAIGGVDPAVDPERAGSLRERLRWYLWEAGDRAGAAQSVEEAERLIPADPPSPARAHVLAHRAVLLMDAGRLVESAAIAEEALAVARATGSRGDEALALGIHGWDLALLGHVDDGIARVREAIDLAESLGGIEGIALGMTNLAVLLDTVGRTQDGLDVAVAAWERVRDLGMERTYGGLALAVAAKAAIALGRWDDADRYLTTGLERQPVGTSASRLWIQRARLDTWRGDLGAGGAALDAARSMSVTIPSTEDQAALLAATAELASLRGSVAEARASVDEGFGLAGDGLPDPSLAQLAATGLRLEADAAATARARRDAGAEALARERAGRIGTAVERVGARFAAAARSDTGTGPSRAAAFAAQCRAEAARVDDADDASAWLAVAGIWDAMARPFPAAYARYRAAAATLRDRGPREDARAGLIAARDVAAALGAAPLSADITELAHQARLDLGGDGATAAASARTDAGDGSIGLTDRELEVLRLIAGGWSNQQIATELFISPKTASVHASNIYDKLGASNRAEAAAIARRLGLVVDPPLPPGSESVA